MKDSKNWYHLIGICGSSMSGIASYLAKTGNYVTGSDLKSCEISNLKSQIFLGHSKKNIQKDIDYVIYTSAVTEGSAGYVEIEEAKKLGLKILKRSELIGRLLRNKISIGATGMHGKTTTSAMIATILKDAGFAPSFLIGAEVPNLGASWGLGKKITPTKKNNKFIFAPKDVVKEGKVEYFVVEACEYDRSFLDMKPKIGVITNIDKEHLDYYKGGLPEIKQAFRKFIKQLPENGMLFVNQDDGNLMSLIKSAKCKVKRITFKKPWPGLSLQIPGRHNLFDATIAAHVAHELGIDSKIIKHSLNNFEGAKRRFEVVGAKDNITVIDDYGHNPAEIRSVIQALTEKYPDNRKIMVFQPHQQQRTKLLFKEFSEAFKGIDELIITDVFLIAGREKDTGENLAKKLAEEVAKKGIDAEYITGYESIVDHLKKIVKSGDIIVTQGATDIYKVGEEYLK